MGSTSAYLGARFDGRTSTASPPSGNATGQGRWRHDEGLSACPRQEPASRHEEEPVGPRHRRPTGSSPEDAEPYRSTTISSLQKLRRATPRKSELQNAPDRHLPERQEHETSSVAQHCPFWHRPADSRFHVAATGRRYTRSITAPFTLRTAAAEFQTNQIIENGRTQDGIRDQDRDMLQRPNCGGSRACTRRWRRTTTRVVLGRTADLVLHGLSVLADR